LTRDVAVINGSALFFYEVGEEIFVSLVEDTTGRVAVDEDGSSVLTVHTSTGRDVKVDILEIRGLGRAGE
jgi:hypothetical protein